MNHFNIKMLILIHMKHFIKVDNVDVLENEAVRTRGSISQCLVNRNKSEDDHVTSPGNEVDHVTPWYEQEVHRTKYFIVCSIGL